MTDNTQELDEILDRYLDSQWNGNMRNEILDWHNKQVLEMLKDEQHDDERSVSAFKYMVLNKLKEGSNDPTK